MDRIVFHSTSPDRIVLSGASSVGKTTLLNSVEPFLQQNNYFIIKEVVRSLVKQGVKINKGADHWSQCRILTEHYKNTLRHDKFITDRGSIDAFVYATWDYLQGHYIYEEHKEHEEIFISCLPRYTKYYYLPIEFGIVADGVRDIDKEYQQEIARLFGVIYDKYRIKPIILTGSVENRAAQFIKTLK